MLLNLSEILSPIPRNTFFQEIWGNRVASGRSERISHLATAEGLLSEIHAAHQRGVDLRGDLRGMMPRAGNDGSPSGFETFLRHVHFEDLDALLDCGLNLNVRHAERFCPDVAALVKAIQEELGTGAAIRADAFLHRHPGGGFADHFDSMSVLSLQIAGSKTWFCQPQPCLAFPLTSAKASGWDSRRGLVHGEAPPSLPDMMERRVLRAGDWLFVPAGAWHRTQVDAPGISINIVFTHIRRWDWLAGHCAERFGGSPSWRAMPVAADTNLRETLIRTITELQTWVGELDSRKDL